MLAGLPSYRLARATLWAPPMPASVWLLVVARGLVAVRHGPADARHGIITFLGGEGSILLPPAEGEIVRALTDARLVAIGPEHRRRLLTAPDVARWIATGLEDTVRRTQELQRNLAIIRHADRALDRILELAAEYGRPEGDSAIRIHFPLTHDLLADMICSSRETVTRALDELQRQGAIARRGRSYLVLSRPTATGSRPHHGPPPPCPAGRDAGHNTLGRNGPTVGSSGTARNGRG